MSAPANQNSPTPQPNDNTGEAPEVRAPMSRPSTPSSSGGLFGRWMSAARAVAGQAPVTMPSGRSPFIKWSDRIPEWMVGAHYGPNYTRRDIHKINIGASMIALSVAIASTGATILLGRFNMVADASVLPTAAAIGGGYLLLDRSIVSSEAQRKARKAAERYLIDTGIITESRTSRVLDFVGGLAPLLVRSGMAFAAASLTSGPILLHAANGEVKKVIEQQYQRDNLTLFATLAAQKGAYDQRTTDLAAHAEADRQAIEDQKKKTLDLAAMTSPAQSSLDQTSQTLEQQISQQQGVVARDTARVESEVGGGTFAGSTGRAGDGRQAANARAQLRQDQQILADMIARRALLQTQQAEAAKRDVAAATVRGQQQQVLAQAGDALQQDLAATETKIAELASGRTAAFEKLDADALKDPTYKPYRSGFFAEMTALGEFMNDPEEGAVAKGEITALTAFLLLGDLAAVLYAMGRQPTPAEIEDEEQEMIRERKEGDRLIRAGADSAAFRAGVRGYMEGIGKPGNVRPFRPSLYPGTSDNSTLHGGGVRQTISPDVYAAMAQTASIAGGPKPA